MNLQSLFASAFAEMNPLALAGALLALAMYLPLCISMLKAGVKQNLATFLLWGILDAIAAGSSFLEGGNYMLPTFYVLGCISVIACIVRIGNIQWTLVEWLCSALVVICIVVWSFLGNEPAIVVSTIALAIAGLPQLWDTWRRPHEAAPLIYLGFTVANGLTVLAGKDWTIAERFYPSVCTVLTTLFVLFAARRWFQKPVTAAAS